MTESFELQEVSDKPQKQPTAATGSDDIDGTITAWSLATFALSVPFPRYLLAGSSPQHVVC